MNIKQKVTDVFVLLRQDRRAQVFAVFGIIAIFFLFFADSGNRRRQVVRAPEQGVGSVAGDELLDDLKNSVLTKIDAQSTQLKAIIEEQNDQKDRIDENEIRTAEIFSTLIEKMNAQQASLAAQNMHHGPPAEEILSVPDFDNQGLESFGEVADDGVVAPPPLVEEPSRHAYVGKADFVRVKLMAGVNAPTDGTPYPVMFKLIGDIQGPDNSSLPLGEARLLAAAQGSLTDSRALFRLTNLSVRYPNGARADLPVDGWIVGEDGIRGMHGVPIDPLGKILGAAAVTGVVEGLGQGLSAAQIQQQQGIFGSQSAVNGDLASFAVGRGLAQPANLWGRIIRDRMSELVPAIQVFSGRESTAVFSQEFTVPGLYDMIEDAEYDVYAPLD